MVGLTLNEGLKMASLFSTGFMAGSALYITIIEVPSRRKLPCKALWQQWSSSFNIAARTMIVSSLVTATAPTALYFLDESDVKNLWLASPVCFLIGSVYTFGFIIPEVKVMLDEENIEKKGEEWFRGAVERWGKKHMFRTLVNSVNFTFMVLATMWS